VRLRLVPQQLAVVMLLCLPMTVVPLVLAVVWGPQASQDPPAMDGAALARATVRATWRKMLAAVVAMAVHSDFTVGHLLAMGQLLLTLVLLALLVPVQAGVTP
jgi:hypothetical protein